VLARGDIRHPLYALTWWQPWGWAMFHGKPVENRTWAPPRRLLGQVVLIHAGKKYETAAFPQIQGLLDGGHVDEPCPKKGESALGAVIGMARLSGWYNSAHLCQCGSLGGSEHAAACPYATPWFCGPVGWLFTEALEFPEPVPATGHQGLWRVQGDLLYKVLAQVDAGRTAALRKSLRREGVAG
jgi:hypothetical protein